MPRKSSRTSLDPEDWTRIRAQGHRMLDDMFDYVERVRERPVWQPIPERARAHFHETLPAKPQPIEDVYAEFTKFVAPYATGNVHPGFMGWVHGGGSVAGILAELLAATLNANLGGRDHMPIEVERQIVRWAREMFAFPEGASGLFVTGTSLANLLAVFVARSARLGDGVRKGGIGERGAKLRAYTSKAVHGCVPQAFDLAGFGTDALRRVDVNDAWQVDLKTLRERIAVDRLEGLEPFMVVGSAGTVDTGSIDNLKALAELCSEEDLWFHIDGAFGALAVLSPELKPRVAGIERADSIALDFHKWGQVPYDAGFLLVRDGEAHKAAFASPAAYLRRASRGLAAGSPWPCDLGPDLSRGFRALKTWFTLKTYGTEALGAVMAHTCALAGHLKSRIETEPKLELLAPVSLNIVCFRYRAADSNAVNAEIVADLHESGIAAPSSTVLNGCLAIRAAFVNHRTEARDVDALVDAVLRFGDARTGVSA
jgi:glutamate/tyrosine decarboxylase-like PLP-dependent enzyme